MKRLLIKKAMTATLIVCLLFFLAFVNVKEGVGERVFLETYGLIQKILGKNEVSGFEVIKGNDGALYQGQITGVSRDSGEMIRKVGAWKKDLEEESTELIYLMTPYKYLKGQSELPLGMGNDSINLSADRFLRGLKKAGVNYIDFRENILNSGIPKENLFYKTDHHWRIETAFWAFTELVSGLNQGYGLSLDPDGIAVNMENYSKEVYPKSYVGSLGRKTGVIYGGIDDFSLIYPDFQTSYEVGMDLGIEAGAGEPSKLQVQGSFDEVLMSRYPFEAQGSLLDRQTHKYSAYLRGNVPFAKIENKKNPKGPSVLFVKDSFAVPLAAFFSSVCSRVYLIDPRHYDGDIRSFAKETDLDFVFISVNPELLSLEMFPF